VRRASWRHWRLSRSYWRRLLGRLWMRCGHEDKGEEA
jgi:hypothetical protein